MEKTFKIKSKPQPSTVKAYPSKGVLKKGILPGPTLCIENFMPTTRTQYLPQIQPQMGIYHRESPGATFSQLTKHQTLF